MRNFFQFIWNNQFTLLFFLLEIIGFVLLTTNNRFHNSKLQTLSASIAGNIGSTRNAYAQYIGLKEENTLLQKENASLRQQLLKKSSNEYTRQSSRYLIRTAHAINSTYNMGNNFLVLDQGSEDGVKQRQGVLGPQGIVGVVSKVSSHYSVVMPIIHSLSLVSCKLAKNNYFGILKWDGKDPGIAILEDIPNHVGVFTGDSIVTRGASGVFPANELVGFAIGSEKNESSGFQSIKVQLATDFRKIYNVYLIENKAAPELDSLNNGKAL